MEVTLLQLNNSQLSLKALQKSKLSGQTSYELASFLEEVAPHLNALETTRIELIRKHGKSDEKGDIDLEKQPQALQDFMVEYAPILENKVTVRDFHFPASEIKAIPADVVASEHVVNVKWLRKE